jgi:hypothetical protein
MKVLLFRTLDCDSSAVCAEAQNSKHEARNSKWFDQLTTLSHVEGQYLMNQIQMTKTANRCVFVLNIGALAF